jgi:hypothetical protein
VKALFFFFSSSLLIHFACYEQAIFETENYTKIWNPLLRPSQWRNGRHPNVQYASDRYFNKAPQATNRILGINLSTKSNH